MKDILLYKGKNILIFASYFFYEILLIASLYAFNIDFYSLDTGNKIICLIIFGFIYLGFLLFIYRKELKEDATDFKKNYKKYLIKYFIVYSFGVILMGISNKILYYITNLELSGNEESVRILIEKYPVYMCFSSILFAPVIEELIFRKSIRNVIKNKYAYILVAGIIFGVLHISNYSDFNQILLGIPYIIMGIDFAYIYYKTNNIFTTITFHMAHNFILLLIQLIL